MALDFEKRKNIRSNYFDRHISPHEDFQALDEQAKKNVQNNWMNQEPEFLPSQGGFARNGGKISWMQGYENMAAPIEATELPIGPLQRLIK